MIESIGQARDHDGPPKVGPWVEIAHIWPTLVQTHNKYRDFSLSLSLSSSSARFLSTRINLR